VADRAAAAEAISAPRGYYGLLWILGLTACSHGPAGSRAPRSATSPLRPVPVSHLHTPCRCLLMFFSALTALPAPSPRRKTAARSCLLLMTDLRAYEIVLASCSVACCKSALLLLGMLPLLVVLMLMGGIAPAKWPGGLVLAATTLGWLAGTLVGAVAQKTFQFCPHSVFSFCTYASWKGCHLTSLLPGTPALSRPPRPGSSGLSV